MLIVPEQKLSHYYNEDMTWWTKTISDASG